MCVCVSVCVIFIPEACIIKSWSRSTLKHAATACTWPWQVPLRGHLEPQCAECWAVLSECVCVSVCAFIVGAAAAAEEKTPKRDEVEMKPKLKPQVIRSLRRVSSMCFSLDSTTLLLNLPLTTHTHTATKRQTEQRNNNNYERRPTKTKRDLRLNITENQSSNSYASPTFLQKLTRHSRSHTHTHIKYLELVFVCLR